MAPSTDPALESLPAHEARDERLIAAMCRNARLRNEDISNKRDGLRREIQKIQDSAYVLEARYWTEYHMRIAKVAESCQHMPTSAWMSAFAHNEQQCARDVMTTQAKLREEARVKQEELEAVNKEFWDTWRQHLYSMMEFKSEIPGCNHPPTSPASGAAPHLNDVQGCSASAATQNSGHLHQDVSRKLPFNAQMEMILDTHKTNILGKPTAAAEEALMPEDSISPVESPYASANNLSQTSGHLADDEMMPSHSVSPLTIPGPVSPMPGLSKSAAFNAQRRQLHSSTGDDYPVVPSRRRTHLSSRATAGNTKPAGNSKPAGNAKPAKEQHRPGAALPEPQTPSTAVVPATSSPLSLPLKLTTTPQNQGDDDAFDGVTNPKVGEIYQGFYKDDNYHGWWMCTPLPWTSWEREIGINFSLDKANLFRDKPECYTTISMRATPRGRKTRTIISGWSKGFGQGGAKVTERVFPVLFFDDRDGEPGNFQFPASPEKSFTFNKKALLALPTEWVAASDLRPVGFDVGSPVNGRETAEKFRERVRARRELHAKRKLGTTPRKKWAGADGCPLKDTSLVDTSAVDGEDAPREDGPREDVPMEGSHREDVDMADAESLSGATAVDETGMDASEAAKAIEAAKILMSARNSQQNSPEGTP